METKLSVNINKIALIRNSRGTNFPNLIQVALDCERFGADGITVHPRPDQRHITYQDVRDLKSKIGTELNVEGNPDKIFMDVVLETVPHQVTLVPDAPNAITSTSGWDTINQQSFLKEICTELKSKGIRVSIFLNPEPKLVEAALNCGTDRIELYTEHFSAEFNKGNLKSILPYIETANESIKLGIGLNAGHDLNLQNLKFFKENIPELLEVSIGHALVIDSIYLGLENTVRMYKRLLI